MQRYIIRRLFWLVVVLLAISLITFALMHTIPGGPWDIDRPLSHLDPQLVDSLNSKFGLDRPWWEQYGSFLWNALQGDLGVSYTSGDTITGIILRSMPATLILAAVAFAIAMVAGIALGMVAALRRNSWLDYLFSFISVALVSTPGFVIGIILMLIFGVSFNLLPVAGWGSPEDIILPALALAAFPAALIARITRASVLDALQQDYVRTAKSKGLSYKTILIRHVLRNAMIPILTISGPELAFLVSGSVIVETLFAIPGIGGHFVDAIFERDYGLIMGTTLFFAFAIVIANLLVDILYVVVDPRIRLEEKAS
ncbi:ABC transporter permease [Chloroflexota bacterium]